MENQQLPDALKPIPADSDLERFLIFLDIGGYKREPAYNNNKRGYTVENKMSESKWEVALCGGIGSGWVSIEFYFDLDGKLIEHGGWA